MVTKFIRKRNVNTNLPFSKNFARVQVHADGSQTFKFTKLNTGGIPPIGNSRILSELGLFITDELGNKLTIS